MRGTEFAELTAFMAVAERKSFARAAAALGIAPSTLSQTIRALEERLGVTLLHRTTRSVSLTEAGDMLLSRINPAFDALSSAVALVSDLRATPRGTLRLNVSTVPAQMVIAPMLQGFLETYPDITLDITLDNAATDIVSGRFDAGIRYGRRIAQDMHIVRATPETRLIPVAAPSYIAAHGAPKTPEDLQDHPCIRFRLNPQQEPLPWEFERNKKKIEIDVQGPLIVNDVEMMVKAARSGLAIGYMIEDYVAGDIRDGALVPLLSEWATARHSYYLYYASSRQMSAPLRVFIDYMKSHLAGKNT
jgi:DNA-binding transcriptional LysR family regulator